MKDRILYIAPYLKATFVLRDIEMLSANYNVVYSKDEWTRKSAVPWLMIKQCVFLALRMRTVRVVIVMFGGYWSLLPVVFGRILKRPVCIILGGTDCVSFPSINYGSLRKPLLRTVIRYSLKWAAHLVPVDGSLIQSKCAFRWVEDSPGQGYRYYFPEISTQATVIPNGFDTQYFKSDAAIKTTGAFLTVGSIPSFERFHLKGIDIFIELAKVFPDCTFTVVGMSQDMIEQLSQVPANVVLMGFLDLDKCKEVMTRSEFYVQFSASEGFPNSICEAMLLECIPIGSCVGAMPEIIGDTGLVVSTNDLGLITKKITELMHLDSSTRKLMGRAARNRIVENYPLERRSRLLNELISDLMNG